MRSLTENGNASADENALLLGNKDNSGPPMGIRLSKHMADNVDNAYGDIALLGCYVITGLLDSSAVFIWGSFVSMQTGTSLFRAADGFLQHQIS